MFSEIAPLGDCILELGLGSTLTDADRALLYAQKQRVENAMRRACHHNITQETQTFFLPDRPIDTEEREYLDITSSGKVTFFAATQYGDVLQLPTRYLRSVWDLREDMNAYGGQGASVFTSDDILVQGTSWWIDFDRPGICDAAQIIRIGMNWSRIPRTVKVVCVAGLTAAELDTDFSDIKDVAIEETIQRFKAAKSKQGADSSGVGPIKGESLGGQYSVQYDTSGRFVTGGGKLSGDALEKLEPYMRLPL